MRILVAFLFLVLAAPAQLTKATGDEFTVLVFHDIHMDTSPGYFHNAVDWLVGANGRGPGRVSGISYYNLKSINGVGDYATTCGDQSWGVDPTPSAGTFLFDYERIAALSLPGIWTRGNHDNCSKYTDKFVTSLQSATFDVSGTAKGTIKLGIVGVGVADDLSAGQPSRLYVDGVISGSDAHRQWMFLRHVGPAAPYGDYTPRVTPPCGESAAQAAPNTPCTPWGLGALWQDPSSGYSGVTSALALLNNFFYTVTRVFWFATGHYSYGAAVVQVTANDGHLISGIGNNGNDGGNGHVTMFKFQPSLGHVQIAHYLIGDAAAPAGSVAGSVQTTAWALQTTDEHGISSRPSPGRRRGR